MTKQLIQKKLSAAMERGYFRSIDLFAGCGGMSLGFDRANFKSAAAIEIKDDALASHKENFSNCCPDGYASFSDIRQTSPEQSIEHLTTQTEISHLDAIDVVIGGPPCQAFSRLGRAALWRLAEQDFAHGEDERAEYYLDYLRYVNSLKPLAFVMENVREIGKFVGRNIAEEISVTAEEMGYDVKYSLLNAVWYGVPQLRERMIIIGIRKELNVSPTFPKIQFKYKLPTGYSTSRAGKGTHEVLAPRDHYVDHANTEDELLEAVTAQEAFEDLPAIKHHLDGRAGKGFKRDVMKMEDYANLGGRFSKLMRSWPHFESNNQFKGHIIRYTPRDYETFRRMPHGGMYPEALKTAETIFKERLKKLEKKLGKKLNNDSEEWQELRKSTVPPYPVNRYPNKFRKMWPDHPARTVPAHIGKDSYSHIHFDSNQARCISVREAARLQSFPDAFEFSGSMNKQLTQIGNAVPPLLAFAVASQLYKTLIHANTEYKSEVNSKADGQLAAE
ncbi:DNA cytosine methyltransferase [Kiloniella majae]|uniref:DNA cytosine methyltransferase n=1 Tax=Kiloniella majae TaxID=1938558 RepID=UPI001C3FC2ED|nr:DNA cytosine methyltransferase [Kiloniella majae]